MKQWHFHIGNIHFQLSSDEKETIDLKIPRFQCENEIIKTENPENDVQIHLHTIDNIPTPFGTKSLSPQEHPVWINGTKISRLSWDFFREHPHMRIDYDLQKPDEYECYIRKEYLSWAVSEKYLWAGVGLQYILLHYHHLIFHASYIKVNGKGIIFVAPSGTGKSTQAELWQKHRDAEIINGDKACIEVSDRPMVMVHGIPFDGTSGICKDVSCPLVGIVLLEQAEKNHASTLPSPLAVQTLFSNVFVDRSVHQEWNMALELVLKLVENVPIFHLKCTPDERAVETLEQTLSQTLNHRI